MENLLILEQTKLPNNSKELRLMYNVSQYIWALWLEPIREFIPKYTKTYSPKQIEIIVKELGFPSKKTK